MENKEIINELEAIKRYTILSAKDVLTVSEVAILTGLKESYIRKMVEQRMIPYYKPFGKQLFFRKSEVTEALLTGRVESLTEIINRI